MELSTLPHADEVSQWTVKRPKLGGISLLDHLFNRLDGMYPGKWKANFPGEQSIKNWRDECERIFEEEGITLAQIGDGLRTCRKLYRDWPPSVPQLIDACKPPVDTAAAYHEAVAGMEARGRGEVGHWSHPAIFWAASKLGRELMTMPSAHIREKWAATLKRQLELGQWEPVPMAREALPAPGQSALSNEDAAAMLAQLGALAAMQKVGGFDHLRWAKRIIERQKQGDKSITILQVKEALAALYGDSKEEDANEK